VAGVGRGGKKRGQKKRKERFISEQACGDQPENWASAREWSEKSGDLGKGGKSNPKRRGPREGQKSKAKKKKKTKKKGRDVTQPTEQSKVGEG